VLFTRRTVLARRERAPRPRRPPFRRTSAALLCPIRFLSPERPGCLIHSTLRSRVRSWLAESLKKKIAKKCPDPQNSLRIHRLLLIVKHARASGRCEKVNGRGNKGPSQPKGGADAAWHQHRKLSPSPSQESTPGAFLEVTSRPATPEAIATLPIAAARLRLLGGFASVIAMTGLDPIDIGRMTV
jgi:hypothetical protein